MAQLTLSSLRVDSVEAIFGARVISQRPGIENQIDLEYNKTVMVYALQYGDKSRLCDLVNPDTVYVILIAICKHPAHIIIPTRSSPGRIEA